MRSLFTNLKWLVVYALVVCVILGILYLHEGGAAIKYWDQEIRKVGAILIGIFSTIYLVVFGCSKID